MSKSLVAKVSATLVTLSMLAGISYPAFAQDTVSGQATAPAAVRKPLIQQKINVRKEKATDRVEVLKEKVASRTAALKTKLEAFKDRKKAAIAERVNTHLNRINQNRTEQMQKHLNVMSGILDKLEARVKQPTAAIAAARTTIATTSAAVSDQAQKDYTVTATSESRIRTDVKTQRDKLHTDLQTVRKMVIDAKQSVANAVREAKKEATSSGQQ